MGRKTQQKDETGQKTTCTFKVWEGVKRDREGFEGCDKAPAFDLIQSFSSQVLFLDVSYLCRSRGYLWQFLEEVALSNKMNLI